MRIFYDLEFHERGMRHPIDLISIGMVREDGAELYLINDEIDLDRVAEHEWLRKNVLRHLPVMDAGAEGMGVWKAWNPEHPDFDRCVAPYAIADAVRHFVLEHPDPELWAWYGAYDHVVMCQQLFDTMVQLPAGFPMWTNDVRQLSELCGNPPLPVQDTGHHRAIDDARWNMRAWHHLDTGLTVSWAPPLGEVPPIPGVQD